MIISNDPYSLALAAHVAVGSTALALYWVPLVSGKGSPLHRRAGRAALLALLVVGLGIGPLLFTRPGPFDPAWVVQFVYLVACLAAVVRAGWRAITRKADAAAFRDRTFRAMGWTIFLLGFVVLAAGLAEGKAMTASFSVIGLFFGAMTIRAARAPAMPPRWHLRWHLWAVALLFNAVHGTFLFVAWRALVAPEAGEGANLVAFWGTMAMGLAMRWHFGRRFGAPIGSGATTGMRATA